MLLTLFWVSEDLPALWHIGLAFMTLACSTLLLHLSSRRDLQAEAASHAGQVRDRRQALEEAASRASRTTQVKEAAHLTPAHSLSISYRICDLHFQFDASQHQEPRLSPINVLQALHEAEMYHQQLQQDHQGKAG